jgi:MATE family multidrug resistance protein
MNSAAAGLTGSVRRIVPLAWPVLVGQLAVLAFGTVDTILVARRGAIDLAALAIGAAAYITVFVGLMGAVLAIGPIAGQLFGAKKYIEAGRQLHQAVWLALALSVIGCTVLALPGPFLALSQAAPDVEGQVRGYLGWLAFALPPALVFTAFRGFNGAVSRPQIVMALQLGALLLKIPLSAVLLSGGSWTMGGGTLTVPAFGAAGCGMATAIVMWAQLFAVLLIVRRDPFYSRFAIRRPLEAPHLPSLKTLARLGIPMGLAVLIDVSSFTFMAFFVARMGTTSVAGHQLAANLVALLFMVPLAIGNATGILVAQQIGASDRADAHRLGWHGLQFGLMVSALLGTGLYLARVPVLSIYTADTTIIAAALPLLAWVAMFHIGDAAQTITSSVLRAHHITTLPLVVLSVALWGVGLGGGYVLAFNVLGFTPPALQGARGFWAASCAGLVLSAVGLIGLLRVLVTHTQEPLTARAG